MAPNTKAASGVRAPRGVLVLTVLTIAATAPGCRHHRRAALRPVYTVPAATAPVVAEPCPTAPVLEEEVPTSLAPAASVGPAMIDPGAGFSDELSTSNGGSASATTPPRPQSSDEPQLELIPENRPSATPVRPSGPTLSAPKTSLRKDRRFRPLRFRSASLREDLKPYVDNADDLFFPPKADRPWRYVVLHHSATPSGSYDEIDREHRKVLGWQGCGYHFIIGNGNGSPDGKIEVAQRWADQKNGVHCRDGKTAEMSEYGIGICLVGNLDDAPPTPKQVAAARALVAYLGDRYQITADRIETHAHLANRPVDCPGKHFPAQAILGQKSFALR